MPTMFSSIHLYIFVIFQDIKMCIFYICYIFVTDVKMQGFLCHTNYCVQLDKYVIHLNLF